MANQTTNINAEAIIQFNRHTESEWLKIDYPLEEGEVGLLLDEDGKVIGKKYGDGNSLWGELELIPVGVDQTYDETSNRAQSGKAVAEAIAGIELPEGGGSGADGKDGFSPIVDVTPITNGYKVSITDANGTETFNVYNGKDGTNGKNGSNGTDGVSPRINVELIEGGYLITITDAYNTMPFTLMHGAKGDKGDTGSQGIQGERGLQGEQGIQGIQGEKGKDGTSVTVTNVTTSAADGGSNIVTFSDGKTVTIKNGSKGSQGEKGADGAKGDKGDKGDTGKTPVKGTDYWTSNDKAEIVDNLIEETGIDVIPDYVKTEAESVIDRILSAQGNRTFTFAVMSDMHYGNSSYTDGIKHACQALKYIDERVKLDTIAVIGDYTDGYPSTNITDAMADFKGINTMLDKLRFAPNIRQMGNHDYYANNIPITRRLIQYYSDDVVWGSKIGGYFHKDYEDIKLRVICLNVNENNAIVDGKPTGNISISVEQCNWFISTLDISSKSDAEDWQILIISHQPLDWWCDNIRLPYIVNAYQKGTSWSDSSVSCNFTGKNKAILIGNIHGHIHNLLADAMYNGNANSGTKTKVFRLATPNACYGRENEYGGVWNETTTHTKTQNSAKDTSFVVYCIDLDTTTINAVCYGAGYDRALDYVNGVPTVVYSITNNLTNIVSNNSLSSIEGGQSYTATLTPTGESITSVVVTMGGTNVTSSVYSNGVINIPNVTGDVVITAVGEAPLPYTNLIKTSINSNGSAFVGTNGEDGYKTNTRLNSSGAETTQSGVETTGFMSVTPTSTLYLSNVKMPYDGSYSNYQYIVLYNDKFEMVTYKKHNSDISAYGGATYDASHNIVQFNVSTFLEYNGITGTARSSVKYMRISAEEISANSIISAEPIE